MATAPDLHEPQIAAARAQAWHQAGDALLTLEAARNWLNGYGLVLFAARPALGAPAPSLVEATLGAARESVTPADAGIARTLVARLVGEGSAVPLNLLGGPGDVPDFLVSAAAFPFVFTLRGDKGWKRPPETTGAVKVSPLALRVYEVLAERGALPIAEIVSEIGREVNESAASRALSELWQQLRVLPVLQQGEGETRWELVQARFLKAVKAGANAGQPTALSALTSLYLSQALVATEEEVAGFLSPLTARSRVREVLHGLSATRQLAEGVLNGKTVLFVPDALPDFAQFAAPVPETAEAAASDAPEGEASGGEEPQPRIRRFGGDGTAPEARNLRGKPVRAMGSRPAADRSRRPPAEGRSGGGYASRKPGEGRPFAPRAPRADRGAPGAGPTRPPRGDRPSFARPWDEERAGRPPRREAGGERPRPFGARPGAPARPARESGEEGGSERPFVRRPPGDRPFPARGFNRGAAGGDARPDRPARDAGTGRPPFRGPKTGDRPGFARKPFGAGPRDGGFGDRGADRTDDRRPAPRGDRPPRPFRPRTEAGEGGPPKRPYRPRTEAGGPGGGSAERPFRPRPGAGDREGGFRARPSAGAGRPFGPRPSRPRDADGAPDRGAGRPARPGFSRPAGDRPARPGFKREGSDRPAGGGFAGRGRPAGGKGGAPGGFRGRPGPKPGGSPRPDRPARSPRTPRPEDEA